MLIDKVEVQNGGVLIWKTIWKTKNFVSKKQISGKNPIASINIDKWVQNMLRENR